MCDGRLRWAQGSICLSSNCTRVSNTDCILMSSSLALKIQQFVIVIWFSFAFGFGGHPICVQCVNRFSSNLGNYFKCKKGNGMSDVSNAFLKTCSLRVVLSNSIIFQFSIFIWWLQIKFIWLCYINIVDDDKPRLSKRLGEKVSQVGVWAAGRIWSDIHSKCERTDSACYCKELDKPIGQNLDRNPSTPPSSPSTRLLKSL